MKTMPYKREEAHSSMESPRGGSHMDQSNRAADERTVESIKQTDNKGSGWRGTGRMAGAVAKLKRDFKS